MICLHYFNPMTMTCFTTKHSSEPNINDMLTTKHSSEPNINNMLTTKHSSESYINDMLTTKHSSEPNINGLTCNVLFNKYKTQQHTLLESLKILHTSFMNRFIRLNIFVDFHIHLANINTPQLIITFTCEMLTLLNIEWSWSTLRAGPQSVLVHSVTPGWSTLRAGPQSVLVHSVTPGWSTITQEWLVTGLTELDRS